MIKNVAGLCPEGGGKRNGLQLLSISAKIFVGGGLWLTEACLPSLVQEGDTALTIASFEGHFAIVKYLLSKGASTKSHDEVRKCSSLWLCHMNDGIFCEVAGLQVPSIDSGLSFDKEVWERINLPISWITH